ncbi:UDP-GlcNAc:betaGal beta-1,3-N-acetylglucosaminyltransferase 7-like [Thamnophis elegans]|uniref:UDP-GlcNAc:betaGal beta-1,3-N-acetylglucosaminyltransferase 7-like n=1 Tax=Thamnophis elegans TaxID=35005 RepID=UPI0013776EE0|nr:UDP-GlcNAc:betaGal beta-1,3-N-acetylglucosaminyltransferase 7-like [Thamnophis elegans]
MALGRSCRRLMPRRLSRVSIRWVTLGLAAVLLLTSALRKMQALPATPEPVPVLADDTFTFYLNHSIYRILYPHLQLYRCREVIAPDGLCQGPSHLPLLLLAIKSHPASSGGRATLRRTWAQAAEVGGFRLQTLFLLGTVSNQKQLDLVAQESRVFGDILMWDFVESHSNLPLKERCFLQWVHGHCQRAAFVFKGEDDVFVNPVALTKFLGETPDASRFIHGHIRYHPAVKRIGRDAIPFPLFPLAHYPHFALEKGFLVPGAALPALYQASLRLPTFPLSDAYWGFLALAAQLPHKHSGDFRAWEKMQDHLTVYQKSLVIYGVPVERMTEVWQELRDSARDWPK